MTRPSVYLDHAATSALRPDVVAEAMADFVRTCGGSPGKGSHAVARIASEVADRCRSRVVKVLGLDGDPRRVAFQPNATVALHVALHGVLEDGDVVVRTVFDHNSVRRPLGHLARRRGVEVRVLGGSPDGEVDLDELDLLLDGARLLVVTATSNVLGTRLPLAAMAARARAAGALVLVDAAQAGGQTRCAFVAEGADMVAFTGHKGLLGPQGTGGLWVREGVDVRPSIFGGGAPSEAWDMPVSMPARLEAGTLNAPGLAGLDAALATIEERGLEDLVRHVAEMKARLRAELEGVPGVRVRSPSAEDGVGIVLVETPGLDPGALADRLDREWGVMTRAGLHCAPETHRLLGTEGTGALRLSVGWCTTEDDIQWACRALDALTSKGSTRGAPGDRP